MKKVGFIIAGLLVAVGLLSMGANSYATCPDWTVVKTADQSELTLSLGQYYGVNYVISVNVENGGTNCQVDEPLDTFDSYFKDPQNPEGFLKTIWYVDATQYRDAQGVFWQLPREFKYMRPIGPYWVCGDYTVENTAKICNGKTSTWTLRVHVPCGGCTLTPGYWKTHSTYGPAPYDDAWAFLDGDGDGNFEGADESFFATGRSWYQVLWTPPASGNAYFILAHAYIAARLNLANEAGGAPDLTVRLAEAETLLSNYAGRSTIPKRSADQARAIELATYLDNYNNGLIGPGHCSE